MNADFEIGGGWGNHISWWTNDWSEIDFNKDTVEVYGHMPVRPKKGQTILGHFHRSDILFKIVSIEYKNDPPDMFFAKVKAIDQQMKKEFLK